MGLLREKQEHMTNIFEMILQTLICFLPYASPLKPGENNGKNLVQPWGKILVTSGGIDNVSI